MIKFVVARNENGDKFDAYLKTFLDKNSNIEHEQIFNSEANSIHQKYNIGISRLESKNTQQDDIIAFCHEDVRIHDPHFIEKVEMIFKKRPDVGVLGLIGSKVMSDQGGWWLCDQSHHFGHLIQGAAGSDGKEVFELNRGVGYSEDMVVVDGFCFFTRFKTAQEIRFDEITYSGLYHFYDYDYCLSVLEKGYKVAVADILLEHASEGPLPSQWFYGREKFLNKWRNKGYTFPITTSSFNK